MEFTTDYQDNADGILAMFSDTFTQSEGAEAGQLIKDLVADMLSSLGPKDMHVLSAVENETIVGSIIFTRMEFEQDDRTVFVLAPVAIASSQQGKGLGQRLIAHGLNALRENGVNIVLTYGNVNFYSKVGFKQITEADAKAPLPLQYPEGWLGQLLTGTQFEPLFGPSKCVAPLHDPNHW